MEYFRQIELKKPADIIIQQIRDMIAAGIMKPGDRLPPERALAERFGVGRGHIREALKKLEFYGILKAIPQSGTVVANLGVKALEGLISNVLNLEKDDLDSLMETRSLLEVQAARLAAVRASHFETEELVRAHGEFRKQVEMRAQSYEEDLMFHLKIAEYSKNSMLRSLISLITPNVMTLWRDVDGSRNDRGRLRVALKEHEAILQGIRARDPEKASQAMEEHMRRTIHFRHQRQSRAKKKGPLFQDSSKRSGKSVPKSANFREE